MCALNTHVCDFLRRPGDTVGGGCLQARGSQQQEVMGVTASLGSLGMWWSGTGSLTQRTSGGTPACTPQSTSVEKLPQEESGRPAALLTWRGLQNTDYLERLPVPFPRVADSQPPTSDNMREERVISKAHQAPFNPSGGWVEVGGRGGKQTVCPLSSPQSPKSTHDGEGVTLESDKRLKF